jgi:hypothetical protein
MRFIPLLLAGAVIVFTLQSLGRTLYINHFEFGTAKTDWEAARANNDTEAMFAAYQKEKMAHCRSFDPFWFFKPLANDCQ